jgi:hypothetical protein
MSDDSDTSGDLPYSTDDEDLLEPEDTLDDRGVDDVLDEGYSPPEKWSVLERFGATAEEEHDGETLDQKLAEEEPDPNLAFDDPLAAPAGRDGDDERSGDADDLDLDSNIDKVELGEDDDDGEVGDRRAGRLVSPDEGAHADEEKDLIAGDVGIDGAGASAEEAAVHVVDEE